MGASHRSGAVLVVEDDFLIAIDSKAVLAELGLLDINIGSELVYPLAAELSVRHIPIVFLTGGAQSGVPHEWRSHPILSKPLTKRLLRNALASLGF